MGLGVVKKQRTYITKMPKKKDIPLIPISGSTDTSIVRRSSCLETLVNKQITTTLATNTRITEKQMDSSPLSRSIRGKSPVDSLATNLKLTEVKIADISKGSAKDVKEDENIQTHDPLEVSGRKRKRFNAIQFKARFKPQWLYNFLVQTPF